MYGWVDFAKEIGTLTGIAGWIASLGPSLKNIQKNFSCICEREMIYCIT
jgi:hypothetical protein